MSQERMHCFVRFDRWLSTFADPLDVLGDPAHAVQLAAAFCRRDADPVNRLTRQSERRFADKPVHPRQVNDDLRAVAELFAFIAANPIEARQVLGPAPWSRVTDAHAAGWIRQVSRIPRQRELNDEYYVDDHALAQIPAALPLLGLGRDEQMTVTRGDGSQAIARGFDDAQAMRMILLQILTGRRASEIRTCLFECLSPVPDRTVDAAEGEEVARFHYAQSKIDIAPDNILVDREVVAVIEEQQHWIRSRFPDATPCRRIHLRKCVRRHPQPRPGPQEPGPRPPAQGPRPRRHPHPGSRLTHDPTTPREPLDRHRRGAISPCPPRRRVFRSERREAARSNEKG
ncbi:hypothetical protein [Streptomyces sp. NPDC048473]|uniref:hypothetical protein n=1 Tax=Streptomyces sp. NPDC048473 TaxID=3365556 RepID=UPI003720782A